jgi:hypothetical protein
MNTAYFPISKPMVGSVIPGALVKVQTRLANYPDHSVEKLIKKRTFKDPVTKFPDMNQPHGAAHPVLEKLRQLMSAGGQRHPHAAMGQMGDPRVPQTMEGYEPQRENLDWRRM